MNAKNILCASSIAAGIGLAGLFGAGVATANAAPATYHAGQANYRDGMGMGRDQGGPNIKLDHHDRKKVLKQDKKELKHHRSEISPQASGRR